MKNTDSLSRRSFWLCCLLWAVLVGACFAPAIFGGKVLAPMDIMDCLISPYATQPTLPWTPSPNTCPTTTP